MLRGKSTRPGGRPARRVARTLAGLALAGVLAAPGLADEAPPGLSDEATPGLSDEAGSGRGAPPPPLPGGSIDHLFELPSGFEPQIGEKRGGATESTWRERFSAARNEIEEAQARLRASKQKLAELAEEGGGWGVAPPVPGMVSQSNEAPLNYEMRERIRRNEASLDEAKRNLVNLEIEANLADVPEAWRY
jgi:hypothetical protein